MGREIKRVSMDFNWPMNIVWKGFINPYRPTECKQCDGSGMNPETKKISDDWYSFGIEEWIYNEDRSRRHNNKAWQYHLTVDEVEALIRDGRLRDVVIPTHAVGDESRKTNNYNFDEDDNKWMGWFGKDRIEVAPPSEYPTPDIVNEWAKHGFGHDGINQWICVKVRAKRLGVYGECDFCNAKGHYFCDEKYEKLYDEFVWTEPPKGDGWQMWETTSEGSPISPVFKTPEELAHWLADNGASSFGSDTSSYEQWLTMINAGWAPSMMASKETGVISGVEAVGK